MTLFKGSSYTPVQSEERVVLPSDICMDGDFLAAHKGTTWCMGPKRYASG